MRTALLLLMLLVDHVADAQRLDPDQNPYWTRYTVVEDSSELVPLKGDYRMYYLQSGMWWNMSTTQYPIMDLPAQSMRLSPLFGPTLPAFQAMPARGMDLPEVRLVVVREQDTMVVELSNYWSLSGGRVDARCKQMDCIRRPPVILPFRPGRSLVNGLPFAKDASVLTYPAERTDARTTELTAQFDRVWRWAEKEGSIVPQLNTDTCRQELAVPVDLDRPETTMRDAWLMRSPYCGTHLVLFPSMGTVTDFTITFIPHLPEQKKEPVHIHVPLGYHNDGLVDVSDWPVGDHVVDLVACGNGGSFMLKVR